MHGMLSAAILIAVLAVVAAAGLYLAVRVYAAAGGKPADKQGRRGDAS